MGANAPAIHSPLFTASDARLRAKIERDRAEAAEQTVRRRLGLFLDGPLADADRRMLAAFVEIAEREVLHAHAQAAAFDRVARGEAPFPADVRRTAR